MKDYSIKCVTILAKSELHSDTQFTDQEQYKIGLQQSGLTPHSFPLFFCSLCVWQYMTDKSFVRDLHT